MRVRHALLIGFGFGGLVVLAALILLGGNAGLLPFRTAGTHQLNSPEPSSSPSPTAPPETSPGPGPRAGAVLVYDPEDHGVLLYGGSKAVLTADGHNQSVTMDDTWLWNGASWKRLDVQGPPARSVAMATYDPIRHVILLFAGSGPAGAGQAQLFQDTWTWDGKAWLQVHPLHSPNPRFRAAIAFDEARGVVVMFGGEGEGTTTYNATWTWDGSDWTLQDPKTVPPARHFASMAYDAARGETVLFGGSMPGVRFNDTWLWDGTNWTQANTPAPTASGWTQLAYDTALKEVVGYVYFALDNQPIAEYTIAWDGSHWSDVTTKADPSPRAEVRLAYDAETKQVVMYGPGDETWTWDGATWSLWQAR